MDDPANRHGLVFSPEVLQQGLPLKLPPGEFSNSTLTPMHLPSLTRLLGLILALAFLAPIGRAQNGPDRADELSTLGDLLDRIPNLAPFALPGFLPKDMFRIYSSPRFGDLVKKDYMRIPVGVRMTVRPDVIAYAEVEGYFTHGLGDGAGYGFDRLRTGAKYEPVPAPGTTKGVAWSSGFDFVTPLSRPPSELSDGYQHFSPYFAKSLLLIPDAKVIGFGSVGIDLLNHTALQSNFGENQLHSNSLTASAGVVRDWKLFRGTLTFTYGTTALISNEHHQVFAIRPAVAFPLNRFSGKRTRLLVALGAYSVWGPDGNELGINSSVRVDFFYAPGSRKP